MGCGRCELLETEEPDIVLLDLMLPEADGFDLCREIRERSTAAVIVVSARGGERDKVTALNMGADDYMTKPFSVEELLARITATLRRTRTVAAARAGTAGHHRRRGRRSISPTSWSLAPVRPVHLTPTEFALLRELVDQPGQAAQPRPPAAPGLGPGYQTETEYVRVYVRRLRAKLEVDDARAADPHRARAGYRFVGRLKPVAARVHRMFTR